MAHHDFGVLGSIRQSFEVPSSSRVRRKDLGKGNSVAGTETKGTEGQFVPQTKHLADADVLMISGEHVCGPPRTSPHCALLQFSFPQLDLTPHPARSWAVSPRFGTSMSEREAHTLQPNFHTGPIAFLWLASQLAPYKPKEPALALTI